MAVVEIKLNNVREVATTVPSLSGYVIDVDFVLEGCLNVELPF